MMSFASAFRAPVRRAVFSASSRRAGTGVRASSSRKFSTEVPSSPLKSNFALYAGLGAVAFGGVAYLLLNSSSETSKQGSAAGKSSSTQVATNFVPTKADYEKVYKRITEIFEDGASDYDDGSFAPVLFRLSWHSSGTYDKHTNTGGNNRATMRFEPESLHGANAGLHVARNLMEKIKNEFSWISYGDLWSLGGVAAVQEMGGPTIPWRPGRVDGTAKDVTPDGRLPDGAQGSSHLRDIFYRMGFDDQDIVALSGAHAVGRCHSDRSGFHGPWTFSPVTFSNDFFQLLFDETWVLKKWDGPKQYEDKKTKSLMMLPTDIVLTQDKSFKKYAKAYAEDEALFFKDFAAAFAKMLELGTPTSQFKDSERWIMGGSN